MIKIKNHVLNMTLGCICLGSTSAIASPLISSHDTAHLPTVASTNPGTLLSIQAQNTDLFSNASQRFLITYRSRGIQSEPIVASGFILLPKGKAPKEGWPILAWAHGTTGVADTCAPSSDYVDGPVHIYQQIAAKALNAWLARGYAVVAPDYQGLGTPSGHPYMNAQSQLHTVVYAVRATHYLKPYKFNKNWYVMGHSQGGAASLAVAAYGQKTHLNLIYVGQLPLLQAVINMKELRNMWQLTLKSTPVLQHFFQSFFSGRKLQILILLQRI